MKTTILLASLGGLLVVVGSLFFGRGGILIGLVLGVAMAGGSYWLSDTLAIKAARARPVTEAEMPQFYAVVRELTERAGLPMPKLYVSPSDQPNAFATGRNPKHAAVAVTDGILGTCTWEELRGVLAHELGHVANRDILVGSVAAALAIGVTSVARFLQFAAIFGGFGGGRDERDRENPLALLATIILAPLAAVLLQLALSRGREYGADRYGARLIDDGEPLARALAKLENGARSIPNDVDPAHAQAYIVNPLGGRKMSFKSLFVTHPPTEERIRRLRGGEWRQH